MVKEDETQPVLFADLLQRGLQFLGEITGGLGPNVFNQFYEFSLPGPPRSHLQSRSASVGGDCQQPRFQRSTGVPAVQTTKDTMKNILCDVLGVLPVAEHPIAKAEHHPLKTFDERACTKLVAGETLLDQGGIVVDHKFTYVPKGSTWVGTTACETLGHPQILPVATPWGFTNFRLLLDAIAGRLTGRLVGMPNGERTRLDLFFRVVLARFARGQAGQCKSQWHEIQKLLVASLLFIGIDHNQYSFAF